MDEIEKLAREFCLADGHDPDAQETYNIKNRVTKVATEDLACKAPPYWTAYTVKAKRVIQSRGLGQ